MNRIAIVSGLVVVLAVTTFAVGRAQSQGPSGQSELLQEVRLLRQAIEDLTSTEARVQIVFGRFQLQEQRARSTATRHSDLQRELARITREQGEFAIRTAQVEEQLRAFSGAAQQREELEHELGMLKRLTASHETDRQRVQTEEAQVASMLAADQARWIELNQQLDDLERRLTKSPR